MSSAKMGRCTHAALAALLLAGCATTSETSGLATETRVDAVQMATSNEREIADRAPPLERANFWAREHSKDPADLETALRFGDALRALGSHDRVIEVARQTAVLHPQSGEVYLLLGRALTAKDQQQDAHIAYRTAVLHAPGNPDALAALGLSHDRMEEHTTAQTAYRQALEIEPDRVATLSNLGLSLALSGDLEAAESELRRAMELPGAGSQVQQNLALVLGLQGRFDEMREISAGAPDEVVEQNIETLRALRGVEVENLSDGESTDSTLRGSTTQG